ncbi:MAG: 30S ribosomal protein S17 [Deltaproteobacteria bacterium]|nr:30S ribosomal protein S17 [Deltaproteobacteria bacterium]
MERQGRRTVQGTVIRKSGACTVVVQSMRTVRHPTVGKYLRRHSRFHAHDPKDACRVGDVVVVRESRPRSATKRWIVCAIAARGEAPVALPEALA